MRNFKIVNLRAFAIITVVIGHSIILYSSKWSIMETNVICPFFDGMKDFINLYQMQLYFFISGYLFYGSLQKKQSFLHFIRIKALRLIIPYLFFGFLWMIPIKYLLQIPSIQDQSLTDLSINLLEGINNGHLWFLNSLFIIFIVLYLPNKWLNAIISANGGGISLGIGNTIFISILALTPIVLEYICFRHFNINEAIIYLFWFQLGVLIHRYSLKTIMLILCACIVILLFTNCCSILSLLFVILLYILSPNKEYIIMNKIDRHSFGIYLIHSPLIYITYTFLPNANPFLVFVINFVVWGGFSYLMTEKIIKSKLNNFLKI